MEGNPHIEPTCISSLIYKSQVVGMYNTLTLWLSMKQDKRYG